MIKALKNQKGFTLIELLAVIVILGIIAAIAIPSITSIIEKSRNDAIHADATQVLNAAKLYVAENGPTDASTPSTPITLEKAGTSNLDNLLDLDNSVTDYSIVVNYTAGADTPYTYTSISVTKDGRTKTYADETSLDTKTATP